MIPMEYVQEKMSHTRDRQGKYLRAIILPPVDGVQGRFLRYNMRICFEKLC